MIYVIGSGPAGVAAASALLARGCQVTMLDVGLELEDDKKALLNEIKSNKNFLAINKLKHTLDVKNPIKLSYGSNFPYAEVNKSIALTMDKNIYCTPSFAQGGLSNVWGAFVEYYPAEMLSSWPISFAQFSPYYKKIDQLLNVASACDDMPSSENVYRLSQQAKNLLQLFNSYKDKLDTAGCKFASAKLAVRFNDANYPCNYCGFCQHGCPFSLIYCSTHTLRDLQKNPRFHYVNNVIVNDLIETTANINILAMNRLTQEKLNFQSKQVFVACGALMSTVLVLKTLKQYHRQLTFLDSSHFILPCLMKTRIKNVEQEKLHTLCQVFLKIQNTKVASKPVNLQIYTYMDHYEEKIKKILGKSSKFLLPLLRPILDRLIVIQGHLDSNNSHQFILALNEKEVQLKSVLQPEVNKIIQALLIYLKKNHKYLGFYPIKMLMKISAISRSFHYGASLPMRINPKELETDILGRPHGLKRIHVVDATVFPSIPAGAITPMIMANAYRIASEAPLHDIL